MGSKDHLKKKLKELFPNVFGVLEAYKKYSNQFPWHNKSKPYASLAVVLQYIESFIFIDVICKRISMIYPDLPIFTLHDNILTVKGEEEKVKRVMEYTIKELTGVVPIIRVEDYSQNASVVVPSPLIFNDHMSNGAILRSRDLSG